jgi:hypothetical protein
MGNLEFWDVMLEMVGKPNIAAYMWLEVVEPGFYPLHLEVALIIADPKSLSHYTEQSFPIAWEEEFLFAALSHKKESGNLLADAPSELKYLGGFHADNSVSWKAWKAHVIGYLLGDKRYSMEGEMSGMLYRSRWKS